MRPSHLFAPLCGFLFLGSAACSSNAPAQHGTTTGGTGGSAPARPAPVVNEQKTHSPAYTDVPVLMDLPTQFRTTQVLPDLDVRALALSGGAVYAGTASGVVKLEAGGTAFVAVATTGAGAVVDLALLDDGRLVVVRANGVEVLTAAGTAGAVWSTAGKNVQCAATHGQEVVIGTDQGLSHIDGTGETPIKAAQGFAVRDLAVMGDVVWAATATGIRRYDIKADKLLAVLAGPALLPDDDVRAVTVSEDGTGVLAATAKGLARLHGDGSSATLVLPGKGSLPNGDLHAVAEGGGEVLTGHGIGATAMSPLHKDHYHALRWLPADAVTAVAIGKDHTRWIGTHAGIAKIPLASVTLSGKAEAFVPLLDRTFRMGGFLSDQVSFDDPYDQTKPPHLSDFDNDGLWTEMNVASFCLAYATTHDEKYYVLARKAMDTMFLLFDVPGETFAAKGMHRGFITRSLVRDDEGALFTEKATNDRWHLQAIGGHTYYWKNDTSSDEYAGHYFGIPLFYDLCAKTEDEKKAIRDRIDLSTSYIVDNGETLIDLGGQPTSFGRWDNLSVAVDGDLGACLASGKTGCADSYGGGGWLNSIEILGHLLAAWHITGNPRYYDEYERLAVNERYGDMIPITDHTLTVTSRSTGNHSDHELATIAYFTLLRYEPNADRRAKWLKSIQDFYGFERGERNPLELAVMSSALDNGDHIPDAVRTLLEMPSDWRTWRYDTSHRVDADLDVPDRFGGAQWKTVFPYDEIRTMEWNSNPYAVTEDGNGKSVQSPWPYLLPYWMMRYYGAIKSP